MFQRTLRNLTSLNSVVFLVLFIIFGGIIMVITSYRLFDRVDDSMTQIGTAFRVSGGRVAWQPRIARTAFDPRNIFIVRNAEGQLVRLYPSQAELAEEVLEVALQATAGQLRTIEYAGHVYRALRMPYIHEEKELTVNKEIIEVQEVIILTNVDAETALLANLLKVIFAGLIIGTTAIFFAGYYLARRALVPIQAAWDKQQQFVADASHELRTPLTVIQSNAELILRHPEHTVEREGRRVTTILRETMRMNKLVATLLTLARADANQNEMNFTQVNLSEVIEAIAEQFQLLAEHKEIVFKVAVGNALRLTGDRERLYQLVVILLDNAVKFTNKPGSVELRCYEKSNLLYLEVEDTGCGIPPEDLPHVFDRFFRGDKSRSREAGGTGLGLSIAQWIVDKHGGKIKVESQAGKGTIFYVTLPVKQN